jgi:hypothetical protein
MPGLWRDRLDETYTNHPPKSTGKAWSLQTSRQPTGDNGHTHNSGMDKKPISKSFLKAEIQRIHVEAAGLYKTIVDAQLPPSYESHDMKESIAAAIDKLRRAGKDLDDSDEYSDDAFNRIDTPGYE